MNECTQVSCWQVATVGPYKPIGYLEYVFKTRAEKEYLIRHRGETPVYGPSREIECNGIQKEMLDELWKAIKEKATFDNRIIKREDGNPYSYNEEAILELFKLNIDAIANDGREFDKAEIEKLRSAILSTNKAACANIFIQRLENNFQLRVLVAATFGNEPEGNLRYKIVGDEVLLSDGKTELKLPQKGLAEMIKLKVKFPLHSWHTIRNFLVHFHRNTSSDPFLETEKLLEKITPQEGRVFCIHNNTCYTVNANLFTE